MVREQITQAVKDAMHAGDKGAVSTLRMILAAVKDHDIAARTQGNGQLIDGDQIRQLLQSMIKQRKDSIVMYEQGDRPELAAKEQAEIQLISKFLPEQMTQEQMVAAIQKTVQELNASSIKDMGRVMGQLRSSYAGKMDFGLAAELIKKEIN